MITKNTGLEQSMALGSLHDTIRSQLFLETMVLDEFLLWEHEIIFEVDNTSVAVALPYSWEQEDAYEAIIPSVMDLMQI